MRRFIQLVRLVVETVAMILTLAFACSVPVRAEIMVVGIDRKFAYDQNAVRQALEPGHDEVMFFDLADPAKPVAIGSIPLENSILGPPTNLAVTPDHSLALIANSVHSERTASGWKAVPADTLFVVDLKASPPKVIQTLTVGRQPSGIAISSDGTLGLVANRASNSLTVLKIEHGRVAVVDNIDVGDSVGAVAISPDGRRAIATKTLAHKSLLLNIDAQNKVTVDRDFWVGLFPWNVAITPDGRFALVNDIGNAGQSDGGMKSVSVIDLTAKVPFVRDYVTVGDAPEGLTISQQGDHAAVTILQGSYDAPSSAWFKHPVGRVMLLAINKDKVAVVDSIDVGAFPEGVAFSQDGRFVYVGNYASNSISVLELDSSGHMSDTGNTIALPGPPASLRIGSR